MKMLLQRPLESYNRIWLATIALTVVAAISAGIVLIGQGKPGQHRYRAEFAQAAGIRPGDQVTVAGVSVGTVDGVALATDRVTVKFNARSDVRLGSGTKAAIKLTTLLGTRYLEISPGIDGNLADNTIALTDTAVPYDLQRSLADATSTFEQVDADHVAQSMSALSQGLAGVPDALPQALRNLTALSGVITSRRDQIITLLRNTDSLTTVIHDQQADLGLLVSQGKSLIDDLVSRRPQLERLLAGVTALVSRVYAIVGNSQNIDELLHSLGEVTHMLATHDALLRNIFQTSPLTMRNIANATGTGTSVDLNVPAGFLADSWMCAISGRAQQFNLPQYFKDCQ